MLLALDNITKSYGDNLILNRLTCTVAAGQKVGLVGANGVGKSTLLKIIVGVVEPDSGHAQLAAGAEVGYLPQATDAADNLTVEDLLDRAMGSLAEIESRLRKMEACMAAQICTPDAIDQYGRLQETYERRGGYEREHRMDQVLSGLAVSHIPRSTPFTLLSGGEQARIGLAALLLTSPDLILLDEPTNHLDFRAIEWLEHYLSGFDGGMLVVSHDRLFLNRTVQSIVEIDEHTRSAKSYSGDYDFYASQKALERARRLEDYERQQQEVRELRRAIKSKARHVAHNRSPADKDKFLAAFKAGRIDNAISRNVRAAEEKLRRIEQNPVPRPPQTMRISPDFDPRQLVSRTPLAVSRLNKSFGDRSVLRDISFAISSDTRAVIIGPNGAGKSTLFKIILGLAQSDSGEVDIGGSVVLGYLDQQQETLPQDLTVYEAYRRERNGDWEQIKSELLSYGLFTYPDLAKPVRTLSVGQKRKLQIACLIAKHANLLLLDEPTNHVSLDVLEQFEEALLAFPGPIIAISHDRRFIGRFANEIWELAHGSLRRHLGGWEEYQHTNPETTDNL
jgi:macrolide transport system ATP-binding/permease protein